MINNNLYYLNQCWDCEHCDTNDNCLGKELTNETKASILNNEKCHRSYKTNEKVYKIESLFNSLYIIKSGVVKLETITKEGNEYIKGFYFPGDLIGIESISSKYYLHDAVALQKTSICTIPYNKFDEVCKETPSLHSYLVKRLVSEVNISDSRLIHCNSTNNLENRVNAFLNYLGMRIGNKLNNGQIKLTLPMSKKDIATYLGVRPESLSRALEKLKKKQFIESQRSEIKLLQHTAFLGKENS